MAKDILLNRSLAVYFWPIRKSFGTKSKSFHSWQILPLIPIYALSSLNIIFFTNSANLISKSYWAFLGSFLATTFPPFLAAYSLAVLSFSSSSSLIICFIFSSNSERSYLSRASFCSIPAILKWGAQSNSIIYIMSNIILGWFFAICKFDSWNSRISELIKIYFSHIRLLKQK